MTSNGPYTNILQNNMIQMIIVSIPFQKNYEKHMLCSKIKIEIDKNIMND
jgi:hypothetical protein